MMSKKLFLILIVLWMTTYVIYWHYHGNTHPVFRTLRRKLRYTTEGFRTHFRLRRTTFEVILRFIAPSLTAVHEGGKEETTPEKQLVLFIWYMANQEIMRETANLFELSLSTVYKTTVNIARSLKEVFCYVGVLLFTMIHSFNHANTTNSCIHS